MRLKKGLTRIVLVHGGYAYKIARTRFWYTFLKLLYTAFRRSEMIRLHEKHRTKVMQKIWQLCFIGLYANRSEAEYWNRTHDPRCVPVVKVWLWGLVIVQQSAGVVNMKQLLQSPLRVLMTDVELRSPSQYGFHAGQVRLVDYAHFGMEGL